MRQGDLQLIYYATFYLFVENKRKWEESVHVPWLPSGLGKAWTGLLWTTNTRIQVPVQRNPILPLLAQKQPGAGSRSGGFCYEWKRGVKTGRARRAGAGRKSGGNPAGVGLDAAASKETRKGSGRSGVRSAGGGERCPPRGCWSSCDAEPAVEPLGRSLTLLETKWRRKRMLPASQRRERMASATPTLLQSPGKGRGEGWQIG